MTDLRVRTGLDVKLLQQRGVLFLLDIEFEDNSRDQVVYSPRRSRVLQSLSEEETQP